MQTFLYSLLVLLPAAIGLAVLFFGSRWWRRQWELDAEQARRREKEQMMSGIL